MSSYIEPEAYQYLVSVGTRIVYRTTSLNKAKACRRLLRVASLGSVTAKIMGYHRIVNP